MIDETLNHSDKGSHVAIKLKGILTNRLEKLRLKNDNCALDKTEYLRGRIREVKNLLNGLEDKPPFEFESDDIVD